MPESFQLARLKNGAWTLRLGANGEVMHPGQGPAAEAQALYVEQLRLRDRFQESQPFVIWDVGLGAAANAVAAFNAASVAGRVNVRIVSFDVTVAPLDCALRNLDALDYLRAYEGVAREVLNGRAAVFETGNASVRWELQVGDFPELLANQESLLPTPHAIFYDPFSLATNSSMWTEEVFSKLFARCDQKQPCALATYSRSTRVRVALLLAGFFVGRGKSSGRKEETTVAANIPDLFTDPLDKSWLDRVRRSRSAEPMRIGDYRERAISTATWERLINHPQLR